ncbi:MAG: family 10 glycosylhydrolase [Clostridiales bacterium]|jgi:uncharacterized lipoprotein YddW (UPF0748 family)/N-acetylmuramoyl-L-alanine amidase|nr:family 10 glycosylhydrolase [Clostridiales bacterium]
MKIREVYGIVLMVIVCAAWVLFIPAYRPAEAASAETNPSGGERPSVQAVSSVPAPDITAANSAPAPGSKISEDFRAVWVSSVVNLDFPSKRGLSAEEMKAEIDAIVKRSREIGLNAIIFQARPSCDALYKSDLFPWSRYITGVQGQAPDSGFDPLAYFTQQAHANGLELHAWLNPYRVTHTADKITDVSQLAANNPARLHPENVVKYDGALYLDPGIKANQELIINGAAELLKNYDIDGIHLDDYFYPGPDFDDAKTFAGDKTKPAGISLEDWRRENVNAVIRGLQAKTREVKPSARFGVSPFAIWQNSSSDPKGSATKGFEAYKSIYSDTYRWVKEGWVDYICPQIYWQIGYEKADYAKVLSWWDGVCKSTNVDLYVGHAAYKETEGGAEWSGEILRQLKLNESTGVKGDVFFRAKHLNGKIGDGLKAYYAAKDAANPDKTAVSPDEAEKEPEKPAAAQVSYYVADFPPEIKMDTLSVGIPAGNASTAGAGYNIVGTYNPAAPLYVNGAEVSNRTPDGFFSVYAPLSLGENSFKFTQDGQKPVARVITRRKPYDGGGGGTEPAPSPQIDYFTTPYYAALTAERAWAYAKPTSNGGSDWQLEKGQRDKAVAITRDGRWILLQSAQWVESAALTLSKSGSLDPLSDGKYVKGELTDAIRFKASDYPVVNAKFDGKKLVVYFGLSSKLPPLDLNPDGTLFASINSGMDDTRPYYSFTLREGARLEGYYTSFADGYFNFNFRKPRPLSGDAAAPLTGFTFVIDPGHGDDDSGAVGPMGGKMPEKTLNLQNGKKIAQRLKNLGANVVLTRDSDVFYTLQQRVNINRQNMPDIFLSVHANSMDESTDSTNTHGLTMWYRNENSRPLAQLFMNNLLKINPASRREPKPSQSNLYVLRPAFAPCVLLESSFMCNPQDFSWLVNEKNQDALADAVAASIVEYYK